MSIAQGLLREARAFNERCLSTTYVDPPFAHWSDLLRVAALLEEAAREIADLSKRVRALERVGEETLP
jgi:hypothetical protein